MKVPYLFGNTDETVVQHDMIDPDTPFLPKPSNSWSLVVKVRKTLDEP